MPEEVWKQVTANTRYEISNLGRLRRKYESRSGHAYIKGSLCGGPSGYYIAALSFKDGSCIRARIHRLVLEAFIGPCPPGHEPNHRNGNKHDNQLTNLEWVTRSENMKHAHAIGLTNYRKGEQHPDAKLTEIDVQSIRYRYDHGLATQPQLLREYPVSKATIQKVCNRSTWKHVPDVKEYEDAQKP